MSSFKFIEGLLKFLVVSRLGRKLLPHRFFQLVQGVFEVADVGLSLTQTSLLLSQVSSQGRIDRILRIEVVLGDISSLSFPL